MPILRKMRVGAAGSVETIGSVAVAALLLLAVLAWGKSGVSPDSAMGIVIAVGLMVVAGFGGFHTYRTFNQMIDMSILRHLSDGREWSENALISELKRQRWFFWLLPMTLVGRLASLVCDQKVVVVDGKYRLRDRERPSRASRSTRCRSSQSSTDRTDAKTQDGRQEPATFDVFLSHNHKDKRLVRRIASALRKRGLSVWLDETDLIPGRPWQEALEDAILTARSVAVLVGSEGLGPWEIPEMRSCLSEFIRRRVPVIPVLLPGSYNEPELPLFLRQFTWVDLRNGLTDQGLQRLELGIASRPALPE